MTGENQLAQDLLKAGVSALGGNRTSGSYPTRQAPEPASPKFHREAWAPGEALNDYTHREPSEDGLYVKVVTHRERIELVEQPPTPEELAKEKEERRHSVVIGSIIAAGLVGVAGILQVLDRKQVRKVEVTTDDR